MNNLIIYNGIPENILFKINSLYTNGVMGYEVELKDSEEIITCSIEYPEYEQIKSALNKKYNELKVKHFSIVDNDVSKSKLTFYRR